MCHDSLTVEPQAQNMMCTRCFEGKHGLVRPTYELVVVSKPSISFPEALLLTDRRQIAQSLVAPVVQLGHAGPRSPLHSALSTHAACTSAGCARTAGQTDWVKSGEGTDQDMRSDMSGIYDQGCQVGQISGNKMGQIEDSKVEFQPGSAAQFRLPCKNESWKEDKKNVLKKSKGHARGVWHAWGNTNIHHTGCHPENRLELQTITAHTQAVNSTSRKHAVRQQISTQ